MSSALAIASVTAVLKDLLDNALIDHSISTALDSLVRVTAVAPDLIETGTSEPPQLNLFMYQVTPNQGWRNVDLPSRNANGERLTNPPLALDLHYLLTAYGSQDYQAEILLGYAMQLLHEVPVLTRAAINTTLDPSINVPDGGDNGNGLPASLQTLSTSELADQVELVKLTPEMMSTEELSKLWAAFQANYRPSAAYRASVVLIEARQPTRSSLPVLTRGPEDRGVVVQADLTPPFPTLLAVRPPDEQPSAHLEDVLTIEGHHLEGSLVRIRFTHARLDAPLERSPEPGGTDRQLLFEVPNEPAVWPAGLYTLAVIVQRPGETFDRTTNDLFFSLAPEITAGLPGVPIPRDAQGNVTLNLTCRPEVRPDQRVGLLLGSREILPQAFAAQTDTLTFVAEGFQPGQYWVRLRVDGVDSLLVDRTTSPPTFFASRRVEIV